MKDYISLVYETLCLKKGRKVKPIVYKRFLRRYLNIEIENKSLLIRCQ